LNNFERMRHWLLQLQRARRASNSDQTKAVMTGGFLLIEQ